MFGKLLIAFLTKVNLLYLLSLTSLRCCLLHLIKQNCLLETFLRTLILKTEVSLYLFSFLEVIWIPFCTNPDCIPVVVLKSCEPELSYILATLFNKCLKKSCFPDCWKVSSVVLVFKNVGEKSTAKNYHSASLLSVVSKVFKKLVNNTFVDHLERCGLF